MYRKVSLFALCFCTNAFAANEAWLQSLECRVSSLEKQTQGGCFVNPSGRPGTREGWGLFLTGDVLWWQAHENGLGFAIKTQDNPNFFNNIGKSKVKNPYFHWDIGFRIGVGINMAHDEWDLYATWTRFNTTAGKTTRANSNERIFPVFSNPNSIINISGLKATAHWKLDLDVIDLELGREFYVSRFLTLRPHAGLQSAWILQNYDVSYSQLEFGPSERDVEMKNDFWGIGIRGGLDSEWGLGAGFSVFADFAASVLYGLFHIKHEEDTVSSGITSLLFEVKDKYHVGRVLADFAIGLRYDHMFCDERFHFRIQAGWENHFYFGQNQFIRFVDDATQGVFISNQGDLSLQGGTVSLRLDF